MKKLLVAVVILFTTMASAQKNSILLGGNVGFSSEKIGESKTEGFDFSPKVGYQFSDKWTLGVEGTIANEKVAGNERTEKYKAGVFTRYSVPLSNLFSFYTDLGVGYQERSIDNTKGVYASLTPALFINMKRGFGVNFSIGGIDYNNYSAKGTAREQRLDFNLGNSVKIGVSKNFSL